jgi:hypothetical protein
MCEATGDISEDDLTHPVSRTACQKCGAILFIDPDTGRVDAHKSPLKDSPALGTSGSRSGAEPAPVLSMHPQITETRDWTAMVVLVII